MKEQVLIALIILFVAGASKNQAIAQEKKRWGLGVTAGIGRDFYNRKYDSQIEIPGAQYNFKSHSSYNVGLFAEKYIGLRWSLTTRLNYFSQQLDNSTLCNCAVSVNWYQFERHHWGALGAGLRGYVTTKAQFKLFAEVGLQGDYFIGYTEALNHSKRFYANGAGYRRFVPTLNLSSGIRYQRLELLGELQANIANTFSTHPELVIMETKKTIFRHGIALKASYLLFSK